MVLLIGISIFSMFRYVAELKERFRLKESLEESQDQVVTLVEEKQNLLQELGKEQELNAQLMQRNAGMRAHLQAAKERMSKLFRERTDLQDDLEKTKNKFAILKAENTALISAHKRLYAENEHYRFKLGSVVELRKSIKELKTGKRMALGLELPGNKGYLIKDGRSTTEKVRIEVIPAPFDPARN